MTSMEPQAGVWQSGRDSLVLREEFLPHRSSAISSDGPCVGRRARHQIVTRNKVLASQSSATSHAHRARIIDGTTKSHH